MTKPIICTLAALLMLALIVWSNLPKDRDTSASRSTLTETAQTSDFSIKTSPKKTDFEGNIIYTLEDFPELDREEGNTITFEGKVIDVSFSSNQQHVRLYFQKDPIVALSIKSAKLDESTSFSELKLYEDQIIRIRRPLSVSIRRERTRRFFYFANVRAIKSRIAK